MKKKIKMVLTNAFDPDLRVFKEAKYLVENNFDVEILCWDRENVYKDKEIENINGIRIKRFFPYSKYGTGTKQLKSYFKFFLECKNYLKDKDYDYIHCHDLDGVIVGHYSKSKNSKLIFDMHEFYEVNGKKQKLRYIVRAVVKYFQNKSDSIIYVVEAQTSVVSARNKSKLLYLPNYPEKSNFTESTKIKSCKLRISYIGAVRQYEQLKNLIDACAEIDDVFISINGAGVAYSKLNEIKNNYNNVEVTGIYNHKDSVGLYNKADLAYIIYPNDSLQYIIGYPVKWFEAIITKTPVIVGRGTVLENLVNEYDIGFAVDGNDVKDIRHLINCINNNRDMLKEKQNNLEKIQYNFSWDEVIRNIDKAYK